MIPIPIIFLFTFCTITIRTLLSSQHCLCERLLQFTCTEHDWVKFNYLHRATIMTCDNLCLTFDASQKYLIHSNKLKDVTFKILLKEP